MLSDLRAALRLLDGPARRRGMLIAGLSGVVAGLEAVVALSVSLLVGLVSDAEGVATSRTLIPLRSLIPNAEPSAFIVPVALITAAVAILKNSCALFEARASAVWNQSNLHRLSSRILRSYLYADYGFHLQNDSTKLDHTIRSSLNLAFTSSIAGMRSAFSESVVALALTVVLVVKAPGVCLAVLALLALGVSGFLRITQRRFQVLGVQLQSLGLTSDRTLRDALGGIREVQLFALEDRVLESFRKATTDVGRVNSERAVYEAAPRIVIEMLFVSGVALLVIVTTLFGPFDGPGLVPLLGLLGYAGLRLLPSVHRLVFYMSQIRVGRAAVQALLEVLDRLESAESQLKARAPDDFPFTQEVRFEAVHFQYPGAERSTLLGVDLVIRKGESVGIVGATGSGKSTLVDLLLGLHRPSQGRILVDGRDLQGHERGWQRHISAVPQAPYLLNATLEENVVFSRGSPAEADRLAIAIRGAQLSSLVDRLPNGVETVIGERGIRISGGERQRVVLARALYRPFDVLVLDEATSALDSETERAIDEALRKLHKQKTVVIIAHRMKTVEHCDRLFFLAGGRVVDSGTYAELLARNEDFRTMVRAEPTSG